MYLSRIEIRNFRNFKHLVLPVNPTMVIVGENKVGKSNLLHALQLVLDPSLPDTARVLRAEDFWDGLGSPFAGNVIEVVVEITGFDDDPQAKAVLHDSLIQGDPMIARLTYQFRPRVTITPQETREDDYEFVVFGGLDEKNRIGGDTRRWISLHLLPALRDAEGEIQHWRRSPLRPLIERLTLEPERMIEILNDLKDATDALLKEPPMKELTGQISGHVTEMVGDVHGVDVRLGFTSTRSDQLLRSVRVFVDGEKSRPLSQASLGTANVIFLSLLLQDLDARRKAKEAVSTILAIEEPEAHLHPHVQRLLFRYFLRRGTPLIVTTHSPHIASVTPLHSLAVLRSTESVGSRCFTAQQLELTDAEVADLERYMDVTRAEILFARGVILVEGVAELFLVPAFAAAMGYDLDRLGISVCSVHGTDFTPYWKLTSVKGLNIPRVIITDGDPHENSDGETVCLGILRGQRLLQCHDCEIGTEGLDETDPSDPRDALGRSGVFVGNKTLEIDLLDVLSEPMVTAFEELEASARRRQAFRDAVEAAFWEDASACERVLMYIEAIGKGRFAQRLADKLEGHVPPMYIKSAIQRIIKLLGK